MLKRSPHAMGAVLLALCLAHPPACGAAPKSPNGPTPPPRGNGRLLPVLDNGILREPSADRAESTDSPDLLGPGDWDWDVSVVEGSLDRIGQQHASSADWMHVEVRRGLGHGFETGVNVESWNDARVQQAPVGRSVQEGAFGPTTVRARERLAGGGEGRFAMSTSAYVRLPGARNGPSPRVVEGGVSLPLVVPLGEDTHLGAMVASNLVARVLTEGHQLEGVASLALSHDFGERLSAWIEPVSVWSGEGDRPWLGTLNAGFSLEPVAHLGVTLGASGGIGSGTTDVGGFGRVSVHH